MTRYSIAAAVLGQMSYKEAMLHKATITEVPIFMHALLLRIANPLHSVSLQVAAIASEENRQPVLAVIYDELVRNFWEDRSSKLLSFRIVPDNMEESILKRARATHDRMFGNPDIKGHKNRQLLA